MALAAFAAGADSYCMKEAKFEQIVESLRLKSESYSWVDPAIAQIVLQYSRQEPLATNTTTDNKTVLINPINPEDS